MKIEARGTREGPGPKKIQFTRLSLGDAFVIEAKMGLPPTVGFKTAFSGQSAANTIVVRREGFTWTSTSLDEMVEVLPPDALTLVIDRSKIPIEGDF